MTTPETAPKPTATATPVDDAFQEVYRRLGPRLYRLALAICSEPATAEDAVQEGFVRVWRRRERLRDCQSLDGYLVQTVRNVARDHLRRKRVDDRAMERRAVLVVEREGESVVDGERINTALLKLPVEQREVVLLRVYEGLAFKEVAERVGVPLGTVHSRFRYAMEKLRDHLEVSHEH